MARPRGFTVLYVGLALATLLPLFATELVAGVDYPTHLGIVRILRSYFEDPARFHALWGTRLYQPYWGLYAPALLLSSVLSIDLACKLLLAAALLAFPVAARQLCKREGVDERVALLAFPLMYNLSFYCGFAPFLCGVGLALMSLPQVLRFAERDSRRDWAILAAWSVGIAAAHATAWMLWALWGGWIVLTERRRPRAAQLGRLGAALVPSLVGIAVWQARLPNWGALAYFRAHPGTHGLRVKWGLLLHLSFTGASISVEKLVLGLFVALVLLGGLRRRAPGDARRLARWGGLSLMMAVGYFTLPHDLGGLSFVYERLLVFVYLFALLCMAPAVRQPRAFVTAAVALSVVSTAFVWIGFRELNVELSGLKVCLAEAEKGTTMAGLIGKNEPPGIRLPLLLHADHYHTYWNLGREPSHFIEQLPTTPVYPLDRDVFHTPPAPNFDIRPQALDWPTQGQYLRYFLIHDDYYPQPSPTSPLTPDAWYLKQGYAQCRLVCQAGLWRLWENPHPTPP